MKKKVVKKNPKESNPFESIMEPVQTKFGLRNFMQAVIGAIILAIPIGFTEETWSLGETLPLWNIFLILILSLVFVTIFAYRKLSKRVPNFYWYQLVKRVFLNYLVAFFIVAILLSLIQRAPWIMDFALAIKRTIIVTFPASLSATIASNLK